MADEAKQLRCEDAIRLLFDFLDGELDHDHGEAMDDHLNTCRACYSRAEFEKGLKERIKQTGGATASDSLHDRIKKITNDY